MVKNTKICRRQKNKNRFKRFSAIFLVLAILCISSISAWEWDNVKNYDEKTKTVEIVNALNLGSTIAEAQLKSSQVVSVIDRGDGVMQKVAEFEVDLRWDSYPEALQDMKFYDINNGMREFEREFEYRVGESYIYERAIYEDVCKDVFDAKNKTTYKNCIPKLVGYENVTKWNYDRELTSKDLSNGVTRIAIYTDVKPNDYVEWIPTMFGERIDEWATWTAGLNVDLVTFLTLNESSGDAIDQVGDNDFTGGSGVTRAKTGVINNSFYFDGTSNGDIYSDHLFKENPTEFSISMWVNLSSLPSSPYNYFVLGENYSKFYFAYQNNDDYLEYWIGAGGGDFYARWTNQSSLNDRWVHYVLTASETGNNISIWVNGSLVETEGLGGNSLDAKSKSSASFAHHHRNSVYPTECLIDEIGVYNRTLTPDEISDLYNGGEGITYSSGASPADTTPPNVTIDSPTNTTYTTSTVIFNITSVDDTNVSDCWYSLDNGDNNVSMTNEGDVWGDINSTMANQSYTMTAYCNDTTNNLNNTEQVTFAVVLAGDNTPSVTLNSPINYANFSINTAILNCTASDDYNLTNVSLYIDSGLNETNSSGLNGTQYVFTKTFNEGLHNWTCEAYDNATQSTKATARYFTIDTVNPNLTLTSPPSFINYVIKIGENLSLNWSVEDDNLDTCWYRYNDTNTTVTCGDNNQTFPIVHNQQTIIFSVNDTFGNYNQSSISWNYTLVENSQTYTSQVTEGTTNLFKANVTIINSSWDIITAELFYNNTFYSANKSDYADTREYNISITAPGIETTTNIPFNWRFGLTNTTDTYYYNITNYSQEVVVSGMSYCGNPHNVTFINFSFYDEETLKDRNGTIDVTFTYRDSTSAPSAASTFSYTDQSEGNHSVPFCFDPADKTYIVDTILTYSGTGYTNKFYNFDEVSFTNSTSQIGLYLLNTSDSTSFLIEVQNANYQPLIEHEVYIQRYYPSIATYHTVEILETNDDGETVQHVYQEDAIYRFKIYDDGTLIYTSSPSIIACPSAPCTVTITVDEGLGSGYPFNELTDLTSSLSMTNDYRIRFTYSDTSGDFNNSRLHVKRQSFGEVSLQPVCNLTSQNPNAVLECNLVPETNGTYIATGYIQRDGAEEVVVERDYFKKIKDIVTDIGVDGVLWSIFLMIGIIMLGIYRPSLAIIFTGVGVILVSWLQLMEIGMTAIVAIITIGIILLVGVKKQ